MVEKFVVFWKKFKQIQVGWIWGAFAFPVLWGLFHKIYWPIWWYVISALTGIALVAFFQHDPAFGWFVAFFLQRLCGFFFAQIAEGQLLLFKGVRMQRDASFWMWTIIGCIATIIRVITYAAYLNSMNHLPVV